MVYFGECQIAESLIVIICVQCSAPIFLSFESVVSVGIGSCEIIVGANDLVKWISVSAIHIVIAIVIVFECRKINIIFLSWRYGQRCIEFITNPF